MNDPLRPQHCAKKLHALAAPERLRIICFLRDGERNVTEIAERLGTTLVNVSHHIMVLRQAGMVRGHKCGRFVYYSLTPGLLQRDEVRDAVEYFDLGCCRLEVPRRMDSGTT
ncbi:MAG TPA: metalloregulator ArsR/SmtB family transcription factor [Gemmataceae bacterium]|nr:metalloregulator ArsR/SmtB family transcription factor [Gemmataceae bacterium]